ncbi:MAG: PIN domain-containing protein [Spirochaetota bacterium]
MVAYLDSSVVLRHILFGEITIEHAFAVGRVVASELLEIECRRVLHRYRMNGDLDDESLLEARERLDAVLAGVTLLALTERVKTRAMDAFPVVVKTLDALHLASALAYAESYLDSESDETLLVFSHDEARNRCARALGFATPLR